MGTSGGRSAVARRGAAAAGSDSATFSGAWNRLLWGSAATSSTNTWAEVRSAQRLVKTWQEQGMAWLSKQSRCDCGTIKTSEDWQFDIEQCRTPVAQGCYDFSTLPHLTDDG